MNQIKWFYQIIRIYSNINGLTKSSECITAQMVLNMVLDARMVKRCPAEHLLFTEQMQQYMQKKVMLVMVTTKW